MTGDGLKELVVVTTRGVQVLLLDSFTIRHYCKSFLLQVLQADLATVKEVTLERLQQLLSSVS